MKICPQCKKTYSDETLNFCLDDGSLLSDQASSGPPPTVMVPDPRASGRNRAINTRSYDHETPTAPGQQIPRRKGSKTWVWVLGILVGLGLLCGGGFVGLAIIGSFADKSNNDPAPIASRERSPDRILGDPSRRLVHEDDFSEWQIFENEFISSELRNGSLVLTSVDDYYYVILTKNLKTYDSSTMVTVRNINGDRASSGFGLVIHSSPDEVLENDYAFLIRSDNGTYRVVRHTKKKERNIVNWSKSDAIKRGTTPNVLEVRVDGSKMEFYINGEFIKRVRDYSNYRDGIAGIYTSDDAPIAFSNLEIRR